MLRATVVYAFFTVYVLLMAPIGMLWSQVSGETRLVYRLARFCFRVAGVLAGVRVRITGREKIQAGCNYVFLSNHQGNADGLVLFHSIPRDFRALVKREMMAIPVLSLLMKQVRFVPIDRRDSEQARLSIDQGIRLLEEGYSFVAFPEGTRSRGGNLGAFKKGVFIMALKAGTPVMPVTIVGSRRIQRPGEYRIHPGTVEVIFHDAIATVGMNLEDRHLLVDRTREAIASALSEENEDRLEPLPVTGENSASSP